MLVGIALRLLRIRDMPVGDLLPALLVAPLLTQLVVAAALEHVGCPLLPERSARRPGQTARRRRRGRPP